ncbi:hypothetical protein [Cyanobacterium aponinum]|uniref:Uncharacterized protein n=1 Tax=Cyanobacterium aponinum 0216 TaxID=2676140 RepID=A0A844GRZ2_9CHRO|nr:hypothetical protein [Cyanobacterium aponinum]MTF37841.1 hypothetical protein [Cyanobacterium aponinum 0216]
MTKLRISGLRNDLKQIEQLIKENYEESNTKINTTISEYRTDSIDIEQIVSILQVTFTGTIAITAILNTIINIQDKKKQSKIVDSEQQAISFDVETSDGNRVSLNIPTNINEIERQQYAKCIEKLIDNFLKPENRLFPENLYIKEQLNLEDLTIIQNLLFDLTNNLKNIRESIIQELTLDDQSTIFKFDLKTTDLVDLLLFSKNKRIYLVIEEAKKCKETFYILERENLFAFIEISDQIKIIDNIGYVRYEVEKLNVFDKLKKEILSLIPE